MTISKRFQLFASICVFVVPISSEAGLIGDTVSGSISSYQLAFPSYAPNFSSATVGSGTELAGTAIDVFGQTWNVAVDVDVSSIKISWTAQAPWGGTPNLGGADGLLAIDLFFVDSIIDGLSLVNYENTGAFSTDTVPYLSNLGFSGHAVQARFSILRADDSYTFAVHSVPEPATFPLICLGFAALVIGHRKLKLKGPGSN